MTAVRAFSRRGLLSLAAAAGVAAVSRNTSKARGEDRKDTTGEPAEKLRWLADKFAEWQTPYGRMDRERIPAAMNGVKDYPHAGIAVEMYRAYEATGVPAHKAAADRYTTYFLTRICDEKCGPARNGFALSLYRDFKRHNPQETDFDSRMHAEFEHLMAFRWKEGSYFRNGYKGGTMDAANADDCAHMGRGLMSYYAVTQKPEALLAAEGLAQYYLSECVPMTYQGCWSTPLGTWVVAPTDNRRWEHHHDTPVNDRGWGIGARNTAEYLTQLYAATGNEELKRGIREKCATSMMKWQFGFCQFDDGACGMCGRDDKWLGMTAAAVQTFLWARAAGFLSKAELAQYRPKALAAADWMLAHLNDAGLNVGGYWRVTGQTHTKPLCHLAWMFSWALVPLIHLGEI